MSLERDDETIACEISVTSTPEQELDNVTEMPEGQLPGKLSSLHRARND